MVAPSDPGRAPFSDPGAGAAPHGGGAGPEPRADSSFSADAERLLGALQRELHALPRELASVARLKWYRASLGLREAALLAVFGVIGLVAALTAAVLGTRLLAHGLSSALLAWTGHPWLAQGLTGLMLLAVVFLAFVVIRRRLAAGLLRQARELHERDEARDRERARTGRSPVPEAGP